MMAVLPTFSVSAAGVGCRAGPQLHERARHLAPLVVGLGEDGGLLHVRVADEHALDLDRAHVLAARDDHVFDAILNEYETILVYRCNIASSQPSVLRNRLCSRLGPMPILKHNVTAANPNLSLLSWLHIISRVINHSNFGMEKRLARRAYFL